MLSDESNHSPASQIVAGNDDLLTEILIRLPIRPLIRFKSVSKHWISLISNPSFSLFRNTRRPNPPISGILLQRSCFLNNPDFDFVPLNHNDNDNDDPPKPQPFRWLNFVDQPCGGLRILQSCNGLLLCCCSTNRCLDGKFNYYIYNPTTKKFATLPDPNRRVFRYIHGIQSVCAVNLAFDPSKSPHYKAVCVYESETSETLPPQHHYELEIYSSETGLWTPSGDPFDADVNFTISVYWNGSIHWISRLGDSLYFNLNIERIATMPMPPIPEGLGDRRVGFFGESGGHLHLIEIYGRRTAHFNVYEMERDYSKWFVKYNVDLDWVPSAFPEKISSFLDPSDLYYDEFVVLGIVRGEKDEDSFLVLLISGKAAIRYNFVDKTFKNLCDIARVGSLLFRGWFNAFQYIESLACV